MTSIEVRSLLTLPSQCAFWTHVWELVFICEQSLSVALCFPSLLASQCMSSCTALLSPEVRWSEMEWLVSWFWASRLSVRCEMNGLFYTSIVSIEMNVVVSTSIVRRFEGGFLPWVHCYFVEAQY